MSRSPAGHDDQLQKNDRGGVARDRPSRHRSDRAPRVRTRRSAGSARESTATSRSAPRGHRRRSGRQAARRCRSLADDSRASTANRERSAKRRPTRRADFAWPCPTGGFRFPTVLARNWDSSRPRRAFGSAPSAIRARPFRRSPGSGCKSARSPRPRSRCSRRTRRLSPRRRSASKACWSTTSKAAFPKSMPARSPRSTSTSSRPLRTAMSWEKAASFCPRN